MRDASTAYSGRHVRETAGVMSCAAFFDVDNTLIKGSVLFHAGLGMVRHGLLTRRDIARHARQHAAYRWRGENVGHVANARERALALCAGLAVDDVIALGEQVYDERLAGRIWEGTRRLTEQHLALGEQVWLVTGAPVELAEIVARRLGLNGALGTVAETENEVWTGRLVGDVLHGEGKATAVRALAALERLDLAASSAYSDSINDLPLLETVGFPNAVNPDRRLRRVSLQREWPMHDFRLRRSLGRRARGGRARGVGVVAVR